jgi:hypothetical protein
VPIHAEEAPTCRTSDTTENSNFWRSEIDENKAYP